MKIRFVILILYILIAGPSYGTDNELYFRHYNNKDGLSHNTVNCSLQDSKGFMWFGTEDGLNRFDGYTFTIYRHNPEQPNSLPNNRITHLFEDSEGTVWVGSGGFVCSFKEEDETFHPFRFPTGNGNPERFSDIREDGRKNLWLREGSRIAKYSLTDKSHRIYPASGYFRASLMTMTKEGIPLFSDMFNMYIYSPEEDDFLLIPLLTEKEKEDQIHITALCHAPDLGMLVGTNRDGLKLWISQERRVVTLIPDVQVRTITPFNPYTYWIGTESGVYIHNVLKRTTTQLTKSLTNEYAISDNAIYSISKDKEGGMWIGTFFGGGLATFRMSMSVSTGISEEKLIRAC